MWIAWGAWVVNGTIFDEFLQSLHCFILLFIVLLKISCGCHVTRFKRQKYVASFFLTEKEHVQQAPLWCARAIVKILNIDICLFCECRSFFLNFQLTKHVALYAQLLWRKSQKTWTCCGIIKQKCIYTHVSLSGICIVNVMLVYPQQTMYWTHIYGSKCFAFVAAAFLLLHFVYWFLNHVAIPCERKGPKGVGW